MRALALHDPADPETLRAWDQFMFGPDLLVAPVTRPGQSHRMAYLPAGRWLGFSNLEPGAVVDGGRWVAVEAPLEATPMWLREGGAVALAASGASHTTSANWAAVEWHVFAGPEVRASLFEDEGDGYGPNRTTTLVGGVDGGVFRLERRAGGGLATAREAEVLRVYGLPGVAAVSGALGHGFEGGVLEARLAPDWTRLEVRLT
jgi:alpha-glucosidase